MLQAVWSQRVGHELVTEQLPLHIQTPLSAAHCLPLWTVLPRLPHFLVSGWVDQWGALARIKLGYFSPQSPPCQPQFGSDYNPSFKATAHVKQTLSCGYHCHKASLSLGV